MSMNVVYVYGTLRTGRRDELVEIKGAMYDLGSFPGVKLYDGCNTVVKCERLVVDDEKLAGFDRYEGYRENDPEHSLYIRRPILDGYIYEYNHDVKPERLIEHGDWLNHIAAEEMA